MLAFYSFIAILMIAGIYEGWRAYLTVHLRREQALRGRVAWMLWVMADHSVPPSNPSGETAERQKVALV